VPLREVKPVIAPYRGCANHQFTGGFDFISPISPNKKNSI